MSTLCRNLLSRVVVIAVATAALSGTVQLTTNDFLAGVDATSLSVAAFISGRSEFTSMLEH